MDTPAIPDVSIATITQPTPECSPQGSHSPWEDSKTTLSYLALSFNFEPRSTTMSIGAAEIRGMQPVLLWTVLRKDGSETALGFALLV